MQQCYKLYISQDTCVIKLYFHLHKEKAWNNSSLFFDIEHKEKKRTRNLVHCKAKMLQVTEMSVVLDNRDITMFLKYCHITLKCSRYIHISHIETHLVNNSIINHSKLIQKILYYSVGDVCMLNKMCILVPNVIIWIKLWVCILCNNVDVIPILNSVSNLAIQIEQILEKIVII